MVPPASVAQSLHCLGFCETSCRNLVGSARHKASLTDPVSFFLFFWGGLHPSPKTFNKYDGSKAEPSSETPGFFLESFRRWANCKKKKKFIVSAWHTPLSEPYIV